MDSYLSKIEDYEMQKAADQHRSESKSECPQDGETALKSESFQDGLARTKYALSELGPPAFKKAVIGPVLVSAGLKSIKGGLLGMGCTGIGAALRSAMD